MTGNERKESSCVARKLFFLDFEVDVSLVNNTAESNQLS